MIFLWLCAIAISGVASLAVNNQPNSRGPTAFGLSKSTTVRPVMPPCEASFVDGQSLNNLPNGQCSWKHASLHAGQALRMSGGAVNDDARSKFGLASAWGVISVTFILSNALKRIIPIALQPFRQGDFTTLNWVIYWAVAGLFAYAEGYKGFQKKFAPLVVRRALTLDKERNVLRLILAGPYSMGLFHATKQRKIVSWCIPIGVFGLVAAVKRLPYPWRSIVDAGVVTGLSWGLTSMLVIYIRSLFGKVPDIDPALPEHKKVV